MRFWQQEIGYFILDNKSDKKKWYKNINEDNTISAFGKLQIILIKKIMIIAKLKKQFE